MGFEGNVQGQLVDQEDAESGRGLSAQAGPVEMGVARGACGRAAWAGL